jgi:acetoacetate decarboxylase
MWRAVTNLLNVLKRRCTSRPRFDSRSRIAAVQVAARFDGEKDHIEGDYILVMFENDTIPIIGGREQLGVPKLYADISMIKTQSNGHLWCEASLWGELLVSMDLDPLKKQNAIVRFAASKKMNE